MILNGICVREKVLEELKSNLNSLKVSLCLAIIQVSKDSASSLYIKEKILDYIIFLVSFTVSDFIYSYIKFTITLLRNWFDFLI